MSLEFHYFQLMQSKLKWVEFRLNDEKRKSIYLNDKIVFTCQAYPKQRIIRYVSKIIESESFEELVEQVPSGSYGVTSDEQLAALSDFYTKSDEEKHGVCALFLRYLSNEESM